jgi:hypothetical protein
LVLPDIVVFGLGVPVESDVAKKKPLKRLPHQGKRSDAAFVGLSHLGPTGPL